MLSMNFEVYRGKRVFVTGHTGFKGSWLCEWLLMLGAEVYGSALKPPTKPALFDQLKLAKRIKSHVIGDVCDLAALTAAVKAARPDFVFHLAAQPLVQYLEAHKIQTRNLFAGNILNHPCFEGLVAGVDYRVAGELKVTDTIMNDSLWVGLYPGMGEAKLDYMIETIRAFFTAGRN